MTHKTANGVAIVVKERVMTFRGGPDFAALSAAAEVASALRLAGVGFEFEGGDVQGVQISSNAKKHKPWDMAKVAPLIGEIAGRPATLKISP